MSQLDEFADNIDDIVSGHNARFTKLNDAKRRLQVQGDTIATGWENYFLNESRKLQAAQDALNRISNAPPASAPSAKVQPISAVKPAAGADTAISQLPRVVP